MGGVQPAVRRHRGLQFERADALDLQLLLPLRLALAVLSQREVAGIVLAEEDVAHHVAEAFLRRGDLRRGAGERRPRELGQLGPKLLILGGDSFEILGLLPLLAEVVQLGVPRPDLLDLLRASCRKDASVGGLVREKKLLERPCFSASCAPRVCAAVGISSPLSGEEGNSKLGAHRHRLEQDAR